MLTLDAIADKHGITRSALSWRVKRHLWSMRNRSPATDRGQLIGRMFRVLERQIVQLETQMTKTSDKEVALLGTMARTLEKLMALDGSKTKALSKQPRRDIQALRNKLAERLDRLNQE